MQAVKYAALFSASLTEAAVFHQTAALDLYQERAALMLKVQRSNLQDPGRLLFPEKLPDMPADSLLSWQLLHMGLILARSRSDVELLAQALQSSRTGRVPAAEAMHRAAALVSKPAVTRSAALLTGQLTQGVCAGNPGLQGCSGAVSPHAGGYQRAAAVS